MLDHPSPPESARPDRMRTSMLARPAYVRLVVTAVGLIPLWLAIAWAVSVP